MRFVVAFLLAAYLAAAVDVHGKLGAHSSDPAVLANLKNVKLTLNGGQHTTWSKSDGTWELLGLQGGQTYLLEIETRSLVFPQYKIIVEQGDDAPFTVEEYKYPGAPKLVVSHPVVANAVAVPLYFDERPKTSWLSFLKNPQIIMLVVMGAMMFCLPKLQASMGPEMQEAMKQQQAMMGGGNPMAAFSQLLQGGSENNTAEVEDAPAGRGDGKKKKNDKKTR